jgi:hypothetical protein
MNKEYLKLKLKAQKQQSKHRPIKGYTNDTIVKNLYNSFKKLFPGGSPSETITEYALRKIKLLPVYSIK